METPVKFENKGQKLFGILHTPEGNPPVKTGIVFLHGWGTYRIGPHRILVYAARRFAQEGFRCFRFDFRGRGESDGEASEVTLLDMIDDAGKAVKMMLESGGVEEVVLVGLCSGGEAAVGSAMCDPQVKGVILWSAPLLGRQSKKDFSTGSRKTAYQAKGYGTKLFEGVTWKKLITFQLQWGLIFKNLFGHHLEKTRDTANETELLEKFKQFKNRVLFIYGGNDPEAPRAEKGYKEICEKNNLEAEFHTIPKANHNFYSMNWKKQLLDLTSEWLKKGDDA